MQLAKLWQQFNGAMAFTQKDRLPLWMLIYLGFLFLPLWGQIQARWLVPTVLSIPLFLALYLPSYYRGAKLGKTFGVALLGFALAPVNVYADIYLVYSAALAPFAFDRFRASLLFVLAVLALHFIECWLTSVPLSVAALTSVLCLATCVASQYWIETYRKNAQLRLSQEEIRKLATLAERERIGRDLHDLLGHTLSMIAIKSELAEKLATRDVEGAAREIADVKNIAREALKEVRMAVSGIRAAALEGELAAARALLGSSGVELTAPQLDAPLPAAVESGVAMIVREAVTNIHRHAGARHAVIEIQNEADAVVLVVRDDGKGGVLKYGNGLTGIGERVRSLAGTLDIQSSRKGTVLSARLPLPARS
ncbi:MAG TPA: sensor histidine kinase [Steroidobacteraceae bacterium]|nr:sensor histidine kinase [Steroidobacteraceae bacterium]